jgi:hypothetical protein
MAKVATTRFLNFIDTTGEGATTPPKTQTFSVYSIGRRGAFLGVIKWYGPWRQYVFYPHASTLFNAGCLRELEYELGDLNTLHRALIKERRGAHG